MAAFIQKLFKSRKATPIKKIGTPEKQEASQPPAQDIREDLLKEQEGQLSGSPGQAVLATLAIDGATTAIRRQAAQGLQDEIYLQQVQKQAKGRDKTVYQTVKQSLQNLREQQNAEQAIRETITFLIQRGQEHAKTEDTKLYQPKLDALLEQWRALEAQATPEQAQSFLQAVHQCRERQAEIEKAQKEAERHQEQARQRTETLELLGATLADLTAENQQTQPPASALDALQKTQENRWLEATRDTDVGKQEQKQYEQRMLALRNYLGAVRRLEQARDTIASLDQTDTATDSQTDTARQLLQDIAWPADFPIPAELAALKKQAGRPKASAAADNNNRERQNALSNTLNNTLPGLEAALEARQYKESKQLLKTAQNQFQQLDGGHRKKFQARINLLTAQFQELSDWQGFATEPKQISLCEQMEYLAEQPMDPEAKAERIKELQNEWRELGGSSDRTLWARFKGASDQAYEPCKAYFKAKSDLKQANLEKREAICDQLTTFLDNADWSSIDWKAAERIHQTARQEWKEAWPIDFRNNRSIQKRFDSLLKQLESPLNEERKRNEAIKQTIVERAEALIDHEPLQEAMDQAKALQNEWQAVGITRHREDRKLWKAFRKACDGIFARRTSQRQVQQEESQQADQQAKALLKQTIESWQALITQRTKADIAIDQLPKHWTKLANQDKPLNGRDLIIRAEILTGIPSPEADQSRRMEIQVQRLADGLGSGEATSNTDATEQLVASWCLQPDGDAVNEHDANRLKAALDTLLPSE